MKKKTLFSLSLAAVMAFGTAFAFAGCDSNKNSDSGTEQGGNQGEQGGAVQGNLAQELFDHLLDTKINYVGVDAKLEGLTLGWSSSRNEPYTKDATATVKGYAGIKDDINVDLFVSYGADYGREDGRENGYQMMFLRNENVYSESGTWERAEVTEGDFDALLQAYRTNDDLALYRDEIPNFDMIKEVIGGNIDGVMDEVLGENAPQIDIDFAPMDIYLKLLGNLTSVVGGYEVTTLENGYTISYDLVKALKTLATNLSTFADGVNLDTKVSALLGDSSFLGSTLKGLLKGIKASTLLDTAKNLPNIPGQAQGMLKALPAAGDADLYDYLLTLLADESVIGALGLSEYLPQGVSKLQDLTVWQIVSLFVEKGEDTTDEQVREGMNNYITLGRNLLKDIQKDPVSTIVNMIAGRTGPWTDSDEPLLNVDMGNVTITLNFNSDKAFTGLDCVAGGVKVTSSDGEHSEDDFEFKNASASVVLSDSHTFTNLSGMHYKPESHYDRTKFVPETLTFTKEDSLFPTQVTVAETSLTVVISVPGIDANLSKTVQINEIPQSSYQPVTVGSVTSETSEFTFVLTFFQNYDGYIVRLTVNDPILVAHEDVVVTEFKIAYAVNQPGVIA